MIKVVQFMQNLGIGGIESWLKDVVLHYDKEQFQIDFILTSNTPNNLEYTTKAAGSILHIITLRKGILSFSWNLYALLKIERYNVIHSHVHYFSGLVCFIAFLAGVPLRISHSHLDTSQEDRKAPLIRKLYLILQGVLMNLFSNKKLACSEVAGNALFGKKKFEIVYCGVDFARFIKKEPSIKNLLLSELNLPEKAIIIGHVGRIAEAKNHQFLIDIFNILSNKIPDIYLVLIGHGHLFNDIEKKVKDLSLEKVIFLGSRNDVDIFMKNLFDIFVFPSLYEGLPLALLEAQAAGLKCLISDTISEETILIHEHIIRLSLNDSAIVWADAVCELLSTPDKIRYTDVIDRITKSQFSIEYSVSKLEKIYSSCTND
jgi:glycosyltransferase involved in cell wall biosynthesis